MTERKATADATSKEEADPYGMTARKAKARAKANKDKGDSKSKGRGYDPRPCW
jgi:hypothetical protein